eukprot:14930345-Alexandrium_andersonii.AAC.1
MGQEWGRAGGCPSAEALARAGGDCAGACDCHPRLRQACTHDVDRRISTLLGAAGVTHALAWHR